MTEQLLALMRNAVSIEAVNTREEIFSRIDAGERGVILRSSSIR
jgi:hypothetical protein